MPSSEEIQKIALLARLSVGDEEAEILGRDFNSILEYINKVGKLDLAKVEPMSHVHGSTNVFRDDAALQEEDTGKYLSLAPASCGDFVEVPIIIDRKGDE